MRTSHPARRVADPPTPQRTRPFSSPQPTHTHAGRAKFCTQSRSPTRPPFIEAAGRPRRCATSTSRGLQRDRPSSRLGAGDAVGAVASGRGLQRDRPSSRRHCALKPTETGPSRSPTRPPFIEAGPPRTRAGFSSRRGLQRDRPSSRREGKVRREVCAQGRGLQRDRPSSRHRYRAVAPRRHRSRSPTRPSFIEAWSRTATTSHTSVAVSNETALHRGRARARSR